jgi:hypothetical protein
MKSFSKLVISQAIQYIFPDVDYYVISIGVFVCVEAVNYGWKWAKRKVSAAK